jgi:imidazolonepropionase-like amidohydrolase
MNNLRACLFAALFIAATSSSPAQGNRATPPPPKRTVVIKAARIFDGKSERLITPGVIVVSDGRIQSVSTSAQIPAGAEVIDLGDATLLPGFMDAHTHITGEATDDWKQDELDNFKKTVPEQALDATVHARKTLLIGFTTVRDLATAPASSTARRASRTRSPTARMRCAPPSA